METKLKPDNLGKARQWKLLLLFNFSRAPLPDVANVLYHNYSVVKTVQMIRPLGYMHNSIPNALTDLVALVICSAKDHLTLEQQVSEILMIDAEGWKQYPQIIDNVA